MGTHEPVPLASLIDRLSRSLGNTSALGTGQLFTGWNELVGDSIATHVQPMKLQDDVLIVTTAEPAWATQMRLLGPSIVEKINKSLNGEIVSRIEVRVRRS